MKCPFKAAMEGKTCPMRPLFDAADRYLKSCTWKDMALLKFCLFGMGLLVGGAAPQKAGQGRRWHRWGIVRRDLYPADGKVPAVFAEPGGMTAIP